MIAHHSEEGPLYKGGGLYGTMPSIQALARPIDTSHFPDVLAHAELDQRSGNHENAIYHAKEVLEYFRETENEVWCTKAQKYLITLEEESGSSMQSHDMSMIPRRLYVIT